jgi:NADPH-dependent 2,4-dienoyl-CoA reductase/sulfur reductase-like enzyme
MRQIVIVGASAAGLSCAEELRRRDFDGRICMVGDEPHLPYDRPPLSKQFVTGGWGIGRCALRPASHLQGLNLDWRLGVPAADLDRASRTVTLADGEQVRYDGLVVATGVSARRIVGCVPSARVHYLRRLDDAIRLRDALNTAESVVVMGAGVLGCELAAAAHSLSLQVTLVEPLTVPMLRQVGPVIGAKFAEFHAGKGIRVLTETGVARIEEGAACEVTLTDGEVLMTDLLIVTVGSVPNTQWLAGSGLDLDDGVCCDEFLRAGQDDIVAAGDVASWFHAGLGRRVRVEHRTSASGQGMIAARTLLGSRTPFAPTPFFWTDQHDLRLQVLGLPSAGAELHVVAGSIESERFAGLYYQDEMAVAAVTWNMPGEARRLGKTVADVRRMAPS